MITVELGNIGSEEQAKKIFNKLNGQTYYNFQVDYSSFMGNWPVSVSTDYKDANIEEFKSMIMFFMACEL